MLLLSFIGCFVGYLMMGVTGTIYIFALARLPTGELWKLCTIDPVLSRVTLGEFENDHLIQGDPFMEALYKMTTQLTIRFINVRVIHLNTLSK